MVPSITRQSVILKCSRQASVLLGNYEFYYAAGLYLKLRGLSVEEEIMPQKLQEFVQSNLAEETGTEEKNEAYLIEMLKRYKITEDYDEQMKELLLMGINEDRMWQMTI